MLKKIKNFFGEKFWRKKNKNFRKKLQLFLVIFVFLLWIFSFKFWEIKDFSAKIFWENVSSCHSREGGSPGCDDWKKDFVLDNSVLDSGSSPEWQEIFLNLSDFLKKIKSWDEKKIKILESIYWKKFEIFWDILDEKVIQTWNKINFYFEATVWKWDSIHEFNYEWKISKDWKILNIKIKN